MYVGLKCNRALYLRINTMSTGSSEGKSAGK